MSARRPGERRAPGGSHGGWCQAAKRKQEGSASALRAKASCGERGPTETSESSTATAAFPHVKRYPTSPAVGLTLPERVYATRSGIT
jgi:hypothetical protein